MNDLQYQLRQLCLRNKDGSFGTQAVRLRILSLCAEQIGHLGYRHVDLQHLGRRHVNKLLELWQRQGVTPGTRKNRLAALRWVLEKLGHGHYLPRANDHLGIPKRQAVSPTSKAITLDPDTWLRIRDPYVRVSLRLQAAFGLRREESIKLVPREADRGDDLWLKSTWCKGGRSRVVPIVTREQRVVLDKAHEVARGGALIPAHKSYKQQLETYKAELQRVGIRRAHGLRHAYAQQRYQEVSGGLLAPHAGGPSTLMPDARKVDREARQQIAHELGHGRRKISDSYLGVVQAASKTTPAAEQR